MLRSRISGVEVSVAFVEHIVKDDLRGFLRIGVAVQRCLVVDSGQQQALLALADLAHEAVGATGRPPLSWSYAANSHDIREKPTVLSKFRMLVKPILPSLAAYSSQM